MINSRSNRRDFALQLTSCVPMVAITGASLAPAIIFDAASATASEDASGDGVSHTADAIHQEIVFKAIPKRVYQALTDTKQFDKIVELSGVRKSGLLPPEANKPTQISLQAGGTFALFGGYITGRQLELVPNERIVQAWRAGSWGPGVYSIAKFVLVEEGPATRIVFDHAGFPKDDGKSLAAGWHKHYWGPLAKYLA